MARFKRVIPVLTRGDSNAKLKKNMASLGVYSSILYLWPDFKLCPFASLGCRLFCLMRASGRALFDPQVIKCRRNRSVWLHVEPETFLPAVERELKNLVNRARKLNLKPVARLNGGSDTSAFDYIYPMFPNIQFWDYTKDTSRMFAFLNNEFASNYHVTYSRSELNESECIAVLRAGGNVAVVFRTTEFPPYYRNYKVISGDEHDYRFLDPGNVVIGLKAKGKAKTDISGFVVDYVKPVIEWVDILDNQGCVVKEPIEVYV